MDAFLATSWSPAPPPRAPEPNAGSEPDVADGEVEFDFEPELERRLLNSSIGESFCQRMTACATGLFS